jgi:hypothetical protein
MIGTGLAMLGTGLLGAGASMWGANKAANAQKEAANQAAAVQREAMEYQKANYEKSRGDLSPFIQSGQGANGLLGSFLGLNGAAPLNDNVLQSFYNSPDFKFALKGGSEALDNSAAAKGSVLGGNQIRAQTEYGQGMATQNLQNYLTKLATMSGQGITAGGYLGSIGTGAGNSVGASANNVGNSIMAAGTADASGTLGMVKGFNGDNGKGGLLNSLSLFNQMSKSSYSPTGGTGFSLTGTGGLY